MVVIQDDPRSLCLSDGTPVQHLGFEYDRVTPRVVPILLGKGTCVSYIGLGQSMEPYIMHGTRMVFRPARSGERPRIGQTVVVATRYGIDTHMVVKVRRSTFQMGSPQGWKMSWYRIKDIVGYYVGDWEEIRWTGDN